MGAVKPKAKASDTFLFIPVKVYNEIVGRKFLSVGFSLGFGFLIWFVLTIFYIRDVGFTNVGSVYFKPTQEQKLLELTTLILPPIASGVFCFVLTRDFKFALIALVLLGAIFAVIFRPILPLAI